MKTRIVKNPASIIMAMIVCLLIPASVIQAQSNQGDHVQPAKSNQGQVEKKDQVKKEQAKAKVMEDTQCITYAQLKEELYRTKLEYPEFSYTFVYGKNGEIESVTVEGIDDLNLMDNLSASLITFENLRNEYKNVPTIKSIYFVPETPPMPKQGEEKLRMKLYSQLEYPAKAKEDELEGTFFVKFIVDKKGNINTIEATSNIDPKHYMYSALENEAISAVKSTSGDWIPAKVGNVPVDAWTMIPIEFKLTESPSIISF